MRRTRIGLATTCLLLLPAAGANAAASQGSLKGTVGGLTVAAGSKNESRVVAVDVRSGVVAGSAAISRTGSYALSLPAGTYALGAYAFRSGAKPGFTERVTGATDVRSGKTRRFTMLTKRPRHKKAAKRPSKARAAAYPRGFGDVAVEYPAIVVQPFATAGDPAYRIMGKGEEQLMVTDLIATPAGCARKVSVVEREKLDQVLQEIARNRDPRFDQATTPKSGKLIKDNAEVSGSVTAAGRQVTITATYTEYSGYTTTVTRSGSAADYLEIHELLVAELYDRICNPPKPTPATPKAAWAGTFTAERITTNPGSVLTLTMTGNAHFAPPALGPGFQIDTGSATVTVSGTNQSGGCSIEGSAPISLAPSAFGSTGSLFITPGSDPPSYTLTIQPPGDAKVEVTRSSCSDPASNGTKTDVPVYGGVGVQTRQPHTGTATGLTDSESFTEGNDLSNQRTEMNWSLVPAS